MNAVLPRQAGPKHARGECFQGVVGTYKGWERDSQMGCVVILTDQENAQAAQQMGFLVADSEEPGGFRSVFCPGDRVPCWDIVRQLAGRGVLVGKDADGYSMFKLLRR